MTVTMNSFQVWINEGVGESDVTEVMLKEWFVYLHMPGSVSSTVTCLVEAILVSVQDFNSKHKRGGGCHTMTDV